MGEPSDRDAKQLRILQTCHYVLAGGAVLTSLVVFPFLGMLLFLIPGSGSAGGAPAVHPGASVAPGGGVYLILGFCGLFLLFPVADAVALLIAGLSLRSRRRRTFCTIVAGVNCLAFPLGTALGAFTLAVLSRPSVKEMFGRGTGG